VQSYVIHVSHAGDGYKATVTATVPGFPVDAAIDPRGSCGNAEASTVPGAILAAVIQAQLPAIRVPRRHYGV
jgi:hypothetical protein